MKSADSMNHIGGRGGRGYTALKAALMSYNEALTKHLKGWSGTYVCKLDSKPDMLQIIRCKMNNNKKSGNFVCNFNQPPNSSRLKSRIPQKLAGV